MTATTQPRRLDARAALIEDLKNLNGKRGDLMTSGEWLTMGRKEREAFNARITEVVRRINSTH